MEAWEKEHGPVKREIVDQLPPSKMSPPFDAEGASKGFEMLVRKAEEMRDAKNDEAMTIARATDREVAAEHYATAAACKADARVALARANAAAEAAKKAYAEAAAEEKAALATLLKLDNLVDPDEPPPVWRDSREIHDRSGPGRRYR
jgi:hypothetical protein